MSVSDSTLVVGALGIGVAAYFTCSHKQLSSQLFLLALGLLFEKGVRFISQLSQSEKGSGSFLS